MFENKIIEDNKILISNLKARMFRGTHKIAKKSKSLTHNKFTKSINLNHIYTPQRKEKDKLDPYIKTYSNRFFTPSNNKEVLPFENEYQEIYKKKYLNKYNILKINDLNITNISKNRIKTVKNRNIYLTESNNNFINNQNNKNKIKNKEINKESNKEQTLKILFPYKEEIKQFSNLPFFSLTKNPYNFHIDLNNIKKGDKNNLQNLLQEDFLYKISHKRENEQKYINNNFNKNKGIKKGKTIPLNDIKNNNKKQLKLELDIQNYNDNKNIYLNSKEKRYKILEKEINSYKNIVTLFKDFENNLLNEDNNNDENNEEKVKYEENDKCDKNCKTDIQMKVINEKIFDDFNSAYYNRTKYNFKIPKFYPINYYSSNQLKNKEKKYENIHKLAYEEYKKKINIKNDKIGKTLKNHKLDEYEKQYFNKLFNKKKMTNKLAFLRESRIRDIIITNKLKCEFSPSDIRRLLTGLKPWNDCEKLDQKFLLKKLPKSVDNYMNNII